jgi:hypothetical protein
MLSKLLSKISIKAYSVTIVKIVIDVKILSKLLGKNANRGWLNILQRS